MQLVTLRRDPLGLWVDNHPVLIPFLDSVLVGDEIAFDLAEEWATDLRYLKFSREYDYIVYLPQMVIPRVEWAAEQIGLL